MATKRFENEWIFEPLAHRPGFRTKRMFGGLAAYLHDRLLMILVEPTKTGRWKWHGVLVATSRERHEAIQRQFPQLVPHDVLSKWLYLDSRADDFEPVMQEVADAMARNDARFGVISIPAAPKARKTSASKNGAPRSGFADDVAAAIRTVAPKRPFRFAACHRRSG